MIQKVGEKSPGDFFLFLAFESHLSLHLELTPGIAQGTMGWMPVINSGMGMCKASALPAVLSPASNVLMIHLHPGYVSLRNQIGILPPKLGQKFGESG